MLRDAPMAGIMYDKALDPDIRSLRQTILYGLKGISAYGHQARELSYYSDNVDNFYITALEAITDNTLTVEELIRLTLKTGDMAIEIMKKLDEANTTIYGNPSPHTVNVPVSYTHLDVYKRQVPSIALGSPPDTGASSISIPFSFNTSPIYLLSTGLIELISIKHVPFFI